MRGPAVLLAAAFTAIAAAVMSVTLTGSSGRAARTWHQASGSANEPLQFGSVNEPAGVMISDVTRTAVTLSWRTASSSSLEFRVSLNDLVIATTHARAYRFRGLSCGTRYVLAVGAVARGRLSLVSFREVRTRSCGPRSISSNLTTGQPLAGSVQWIASPSTASSQRKVEFYVDGSLEWTTVNPPYSFGGAGGYLRTITLRNGVHELVVAAYPLSGKAVTQSSRVLVANQGASRRPPTFPAVGIAAGASLQDWSPTDLDRQFGDYQNLHAAWIRHDFDWSRIEPQPGTYDWVGYDHLVHRARDHGLNVIATISYTPPWANGDHSDHRYQPNSADQFGQFAGLVAARYAPAGVHAYEIWNEPNVASWQPVPSPSAYVQVLCSAYRSIHAADPQAIVITGGASPAGDSTTTFSPQTWLADVYAAGGKACFDAVGYHPYVDSTSSPGSLGTAWQLMGSRSPTLRGIILANGDASKRIWATEVGCNRSKFGDAECSNRVQEALRAWHSYSWAGVLNWFIYWDPNVYGLVDSDWIPRPEWYAYQVAANAFR